MRKVSIKNKRGERLIGILHEGKNKELVIFCHGRLCSKSSFFYPALCRKTAKLGFPTFRFDFSGNGESQGGFRQSTLTKSIEDLSCVCSHFEAQGYELHCIIGHSFGAVISLVFQSMHQKANLLVDIAGVLDQRQQTQERFSREQIEKIQARGFITKDKIRISKEYLNDRLSYGNIGRLASAITVPVLVVHGSADQEVPVDSSVRMMNFLNPKSRLSLVLGADHYFKKERHRQKLFSEIAKWL